MLRLLLFSKRQELWRFYQEYNDKLREFCWGIGLAKQQRIAYSFSAKKRKTIKMRLKGILVCVKSFLEMLNFIIQCSLLGNILNIKETMKVFGHLYFPIWFTSDNSATLPLVVNESTNAIR